VTTATLRTATRLPRASTVTIRSLLLEQAAKRIEARLLELDKRVEGQDEGAWNEYVELAVALAALAPATLPEATGRLLTTREMVERLGISSRTLRRWRQRGEVRPAVERRRALRWTGREAGG
jgi:helix-turn-helix protein